jgi:hypothetical protein
MAFNGGLLISEDVQIQVAIKLLITGHIWQFEIAVDHEDGGVMTLILLYDPDFLYYFLESILNGIVEKSDQSYKSINHREQL